MKAVPGRLAANFTRGRGAPATASRHWTAPARRWLAGVAIGCACVVALDPGLGAAAPAPLRPVVEVEEDVYRYTPANNGAGPMWCANSTCLVRSGEFVYAAGLETVEGAEPLNNCRWMLFRRGGTGGWERVFVDEDGRTREPAPVVGLGDGQVLVSANPTLGKGPEPNGGPARPEIWVFSGASGAGQPDRWLPQWSGTPPFREHSYRSFVADSARGEFLLLQNIGYTHAAWVVGDRAGRWSGSGRLEWPWGADYEKPQPIRVCYPAVALHRGAAYFFGVSDILEPRRAWREYKRELTGREWDYDFRRLFFTWTPEIRTRPFAAWVEVASRESTAGGAWACDLRVAEDGSVHLLWTERAIDERLRERFFPEAVQEHTLNYGLVREGKVVRRHTIERQAEGETGWVGSAARFQASADGRVFVIYHRAGFREDGRRVTENVVREVSADGRFQAAVPIGFERPFTGFFTATVRCGSPPSRFVELLGPREGVAGAIAYARVRLY